MMRCRDLVLLLSRFTKHVFPCTSWSIEALLTRCRQNRGAREADFRSQDGRLMAMEPQEKSRHQQIPGMQEHSAHDLGYDAVVM
jgi:hypothetical protein